MGFERKCPCAYIQYSYFTFERNMYFFLLCINFTQASFVTQHMYILLHNRTTECGEEEI